MVDTTPLRNEPDGDEEYGEDGNGGENGGRYSRMMLESSQEIEIKTAKKRGSLRECFPGDDSLLTYILTTCTAVCAILLAILVVRQPTSGPTTAVQTPSSSPSAAANMSVLESMERTDGILPLYVSKADALVYMEVSEKILSGDTYFIYAERLAQGLGSNDAGLDRGKLGQSFLTNFEKVGEKVRLVAQNARHTALSSHDDAESSVEEESFAPSVLYAFDVVDILPEGSGVVVDVSSLFGRDTYGRAPGGIGAVTGYSLDAELSTPVLEDCRAFERNTEIAVSQTFVTDGTGHSRYPMRGPLAASSAAPTSFTVVVRHSLVLLQNDCAPRAFHVRSGFNYNEIEDHSRPIGESVGRRFIVRHCVQPGEQLRYYLDPGTPEPMRSAILDGARYWSEAFAAVGIEFVVDVLPDDMSIHDVRLNIIEWVHRETRGWSYGMTFTNPFSGQIMKAHVTLGSRRVRQDYLLAEGLLSPYADGASYAYTEDDDPMLKLSLHRLRQLAAHEVGHSLGLKHNFAASTWTERASVMDYPSPRVGLDSNGLPTIGDDVYDNTGIGEWDKLVIRYGYGTEPLDAVLQEAVDRGIVYLSDDDARPLGSTSPITCIWDDSGAGDAAEQLEHELAVRRGGLRRMAEDPGAALRPGTPHALLGEVFVPLYLHHRFQVQCTAHAVGGENYRFSVVPEPPSVSAVSADFQRAALRALIACIDPSELRVPSSISSYMMPRPYGYQNSVENDNRELIVGYTGRAWDPLAPAEIAAGLVFDNLLHPTRVARLAAAGSGAIRGESEDPLTLTEVLHEVSVAVFLGGGSEEDPSLKQVRRVVQRAYVDSLLELAEMTRAGTSSAEVDAAVFATLTAIAKGDGLPQDDSLVQLFGAQARQMLGDLAPPSMPFGYDNNAYRGFLPMPPGDPIGSVMDMPELNAVQARLARRRAALSSLLS